MRSPSRIASPGSGTRSITASPIDLTRVPPAGRSTSTAAHKASTTATACSSPCASVSAVKPAMSANTNVAAVSAIRIGGSSGRSGLSRLDVEAEHHPALVMLRDVAVRHPATGIADVEKDVNRLARADEHGVLPDEVRLGGTVTRKDEKAPGTMNVERVWHRVIRVHLVQQADLHLVANAEAPVDRGVLGTG